LNGDGHVSLADLTILLSDFGCSTAPCGGDVDHDGDTDFGDLYKGDVFEVFLHTDPKTPMYFEYEMNQLNKELVLLIPNINGRAYGWLPWRYEKDRTVKKMVNVVGGFLVTHRMLGKFRRKE
jgi:hypothetical protein